MPGKKQNKAKNSMQKSSPKKKAGLIQAKQPNPLLSYDILVLQGAIGNQAVNQIMTKKTPEQSIQKKKNMTSLPDKLKERIEQISGLSMDDVKVHRDSPKPADVNASAYTQGRDIYIGQGQEKYLAHEAWHVVQQKKGRVKPTAEINGMAINDSACLEKEADEMGNKALGAALLHGDGSRLKIQKNSDVLQLRVENPFYEKEDYASWDISAHHIIPHTELEKALALLNPAQEKEVLCYAIPDKITKKMLDNLHVVTGDSDPAREKLRKDLSDVNKDGATEVAGVSYNDIRKSFFLWQGGNQFRGPNTSIRAEPSDSKDAIDFDAGYVNPYVKDTVTLCTLTGLGGSLKKEKEKSNIVKNLKAILDITKNKTPTGFDRNEWVDVDTLDELEKLEKSEDLKRKHIMEYAFFKLPYSKIKTKEHGGDYDKIEEKDGNLYYYGELLNRSKVKAPLVYINMSEARNTKATTTTERPLKEVLKELGIEPAKKEAFYEIPDTFANIAITKKKDRYFFSVKGFDESIPCKKEEKVLKVNAAIFEKRNLKTTVEGITLYKYCKDKLAPTSSFLPKKLYDTIKK